MTLRRFLAAFVLFALALAPSGRLGMVEAAATPHHAAMPAHCSDQQAPDNRQNERGAIDCMIACAAMVAAASPALAPPPEQQLAAITATLPEPPGVLPQAEPPPPRPV